MANGEKKENPYLQWVKPATPAPVNQMALEAAAASPDEDIPVVPQVTAPAPAPAAPGPLDQGAFSRGTGMLSSVQPGQDRLADLTLEDLDRALLNIPGMPTVAEFASRFNMNVADTIDFFGPDIINGVLALTDAEARVPTARGLAEGAGAGGEFMEPGIARDATRLAADYAQLAAGFSAALKKLPDMLPNAQQVEGAKQVGVNVTEQMAKGVQPIRDTILGATGGIGETYGQEYGGSIGGFAGSLAAPLGFGMAEGFLRKGLKSGGDAFRQVRDEVVQTSDLFNKAEAEKLIARMLYNEGLTPEEAVQQYKALGDEATIADLDGNFLALLENAAIHYPRVQNFAAGQFNQRMKDQSKRLLNAFDDTTGTSLLTGDAEMQRLNSMFEKPIADLYQQSRDSGMQLSTATQKMIQDSPLLQKYHKMAVDEMANEVAIHGYPPGTIDYVDFMKKAMDDDIKDLIDKDAKPNKLRSLLAAKKQLLKEADAQIPEYAEARESFASLAEMQNALDIGQRIFKLSEKPTDFKQIVGAMNPTEKKLAQLGAKDAIFDEFNRDLETGTRVVRKLRIQGTKDKLRQLFDSDEAYEKFYNNIYREVQFARTKNEITAGSQTAKRLVRAELGKKDAEMQALLKDTRRPEKEGKAWVMDKLSALYEGGKDKLTWTPKQIDALETAADILMVQGMDPEDVLRIFKQVEDPIEISGIIADWAKYYEKPIWRGAVPAAEITAPQAVEAGGQIIDEAIEMPGEEK